MMARLQPERCAKAAIWQKTEKTVENGRKAVGKR
jgi:hypothetical protein